MFGLALVDCFIIALYFGVILVVGIYFRSSSNSTSDFIVGGKNIPWYFVLGSIVATEISGMTFLNVPGDVISGNMTYLQTTVGSVLARFLIAGVLLGAFYASNCFSIYQYLADRFGRRTQLMGSSFFILSRLFASGIRLLVATGAISLILNVSFLPCLIIFTVVALIYTGSGGIKAVIYTDCIQAFVFISGGLAVAVFLLNEVGWTQIMQYAGDEGKFEVFRFRPSTEGVGAWFNDSKLWYVAIAFGFLNTSAALGTDQDMTQRMLTCKNVNEARLSVILSGFIGFAVAALFLFVGVCVYAYFKSKGIDLPSANNMFPQFLATALPPGLKGLLLVGAFAAAMSSLDSAMAALSSSVVMDILKPMLGDTRSEGDWVKISRIMVLVFASILVVIAYLLNKVDVSYLWLSFKIVGIPYSILLGVFLLGTLTDRGQDKFNIRVMFTGIIFVSCALWMVENKMLDLAWPWVLLFGTSWSFAAGAIAPGSDKGAR